MAVPRYDQRIIDHEVKLTRTTAALERALAGQKARGERRQALAEALWVRQQYVAMLRSARDEGELRELGLTDEMIRDVRLGDSVSAAWRRFRARDA